MFYVCLTFPCALNEGQNSLFSKNPNHIPQKSITIDQQSYTRLIEEHSGVRP